jgi:hypothetical protein
MRWRVVGWRAGMGCVLGASTAGCLVWAPDGSYDSDTAGLSETDIGALDPGGVDLPPGELSGVDACYLGASGRGDACFELVKRDASWGASYLYPDSGDARYAPPIRFLDLGALDPDAPLAPHFVLDELAVAWKGRFGVVQPHLIEHLEAIRGAIGQPLFVNSGYRNPSYNAGVGGVELSRHQWGDAADLDASGLTLEDIAVRCEEQGVDYVGWYEAHIHCDWRNDPLSTPFFGRGGGTSAPGEPRIPTLDASLVRDPASGGRVWSAPATGWEEGEPLREWTALAADGSVLQTGTGRRFEPPPGAEAVSVRVGRALTVHAAVGAR